MYNKPDDFEKLCDLIAHWLLSKLKHDGRISAETAVCTAAGLAGRYMLRSLSTLALDQYSLGESIFAPEISEAALVAMNQILEAAHRVGIDANPDSGWIGVPSAESAPQQTVFELNNFFEPLLEVDIWVRLDFLPVFKSRALSVTAVKFIVMTQSVFSLVEAKKRLIWSFHEGLKVVPSPLVL